MKTYLTSGHCYQSNIFLVAPPIIFILCSNFGITTLVLIYCKPVYFLIHDENIQNFYSDLCAFKGTVA